MSDESIPELSPEDARKAKQREYNRQYRLRNLARITALHNAWCAQNIERVREQKLRSFHKSFAKNPEKHRQRGARSRANRKALTGSTAFPGHTVGRARRKAREQQAPVNDFTVKQWRALCKAAGYRCCYCGKKFPSTKLTPDHLTPYAKQGSNTLHNVLPCCLSCNCRKKDRAVLKPVQPFLLIDEGAAD